MGPARRNVFGKYVVLGSRSIRGNRRQPKRQVPCQDRREQSQAAGVQRFSALPSADRAAAFRPMQAEEALLYAAGSRTCVALFLGSSAVEHPTVNRMVAGSNPARGAIGEKRPLILLHFFLPVDPYRLAPPPKVGHIRSRSGPRAVATKLGKQRVSRERRPWLRMIRRSSSTLCEQLPLMVKLTTQDGSSPPHAAQR
jgi:hypothetical protein